MLLAFLFYLFIVISVIDILHLGFYLIGANYYDMKRFKASSQRPRRARGLRPLVSVLIPAHNEEKSIVRCLDSVRTNTYRKLEIIVIDDASKDSTRRLVRQYIAAHPKRDIRLMYKQKNGGKANALNHALRHGARGDIIMTLDADSVLHKNSITNAVRYYDDPRVMGVAANVRVLDSLTILGLLQKFEYMIGYRSKKFFSVTNSEYIIGGVASTYRRSVLKQVGYYSDDSLTEDIGLSLKVASLGNRANRLVYGVDVLAMTEGVQNFKTLLRQRYRWKMGSMQSLFKHRELLGKRDANFSRMLTYYRIPMAYLGELIVLLEPMVIGFVFYLCLQAMNPAMVVGAYMTITLYLIWNIMPDEHMNLVRKLRMIGYAPIMYFLMYTMNVVQLYAGIRCLLNSRQIRGKGNQRTTWVSPERAGQTQVQFS